MKATKGLCTSMLMLAILFIAMPQSALAQYSPKSLNISGALFQPVTGLPVTNTSVNFRLEIWDKNGTCKLYDETHSAQNLSTTKGGFSLQLGEGTPSANYVFGGGDLTWHVFSNPGAPATTVTGCPGGVVLNQGDNRLIKVFYDLGGGMTELTPGVPIESSAYAMIADTIQGRGLNDLIVVRDDVGTDLTQSNVENIFSASNYAKLVQLLTNTLSASYSFNNQTITNVGTPSAGGDAVNKTYADSRLAGSTVNTAGVASGNTLIWNGSAWMVGTPSATDATKLPLAGGIMTGPLTLQHAMLGKFNNAQEGALTLGAGDAGRIFYNTDTNQLRLWNGSTYFPFGSGSPTGVAGGDLTGTYPNPTINVGTVTTAKIATDAITASKIDNAGIGINRLLISDGTDPNLIRFKTCTLNQILQWQGTGWVCTDVGAALPTTGIAAGVYGSSTTVSRVGLNAQGVVTLAQNVAIAFPVTSVAGKTGAVTLNPLDVGVTGTAALYNVGDLTGELPMVQANGKLSPGVIPTLGIGDISGAITQIVASSPLTGGGTSGVVTIGIDASLVDAARIRGNNVLAGVPADNQVLTWNNSASRWEARTPGAGADNLGSHIAGQNVQLNGFWLTNDGVGNDGIRIDNSGNVGVGTTGNATAVLDIWGLAANSAMIVPRDTQANRPAGTNGMLRYNTNTSKMEVFEGGLWVDVVQAGDGGILTLTGTNGALVAGPATVKTISIDTGVTTGQIVQVDSGNRLPVIDGSQLTGISNLRGVNVATTAPAANQVLKYNGSGWAPMADTGMDVAAGTAILLSGPATLKTISVDVGIGANQIPQLNANGYLGIGTATVATGAVADFWGATANDSAVVMPRASTANRPATGVNGMIRYNTSLARMEIFENGGWTDVVQTFTDTGIVTLTGTNGALVSGPATVKTIGIDTGVTTGQIVQVDTGNRLPVIDGSQLTQISNLRNVNVSTAAPTGGQVLRYNGSAWEAFTLVDNAGVTLVAMGSGMVPGNISATGTISVDVGTGPNQIVQLDGSSRIPAVNGSLLTNVNAVQLQSNNVLAGVPADNQVLTWNATATRWEARAPGAGADNLGSHVAAQNVQLNGFWLTNDGVGNDGIRIDNSGNVGVGTTGNATAVLDVWGAAANSAMIVPRDTQANRPAGTNGMIRYNTNTAKMEIFENGGWTDVVQTFTDTGIVTLTGTNGALVSGSATVKTIGIDTGVTTGQIVQVDSGNRLPVIDGSQLTQISNLRGVNVATTAPAANQVLKYNGTGWAPMADTGMDVAAGTAILLSGPATLKTISVDVGIGANQIPQYNSSGYLGIGTATVTSGVIAEFFGTTANDSAVLLPRATTGNRPTTGVNGMIRYNTSLAKFEVYENGNWYNMATGTGADNLGNHIATQNLRLGTNWLNNDGDAGEGLRVNTNGSIEVASSNGSMFRKVETTFNIVPQYTNDTTGHVELQAWDDVGTTGARALSLQPAGGSVGIGTTNPIADWAGIGLAVNNGDMVVRTGAGIYAMGPANDGNYMSVSSNGTSGLVRANGANLGLDLSTAGVQPITLNSNNVERMRITASGRVGVGTNNPNAGAILDLNGTGNISSLLLPRGTTVERAVAAANGMIRYNTNISKFEVYENGNWANMVSAGGGLSGLTTTRIPFATSATSLGDDGAMVWDNTNKQLAITTANGLNSTLPIMHLTNNDATGGQSMGLRVTAGNNTSDIPLRVETRGGSDLLVVDGAGLVSIDGSLDIYTDLDSMGAVNLGNGTGADALTINTGTAGGTFTSAKSTAGSVFSFDATNAGTDGPLIDVQASAASRYAFRVTANNGATESLYVRADGVTGIGTNSPDVGSILTLNGTGNLSSLLLPRGTTAERAVAAANGMIRYNTNITAFEVYAGSWQTMATSSSGDNLGNHTATTGILAITGTAANPSYTFAADPNTGIFSAGVDRMAFSTNGTERMRITDAGFVGIGTNNPAERLEVNVGSGGGAVNVTNYVDNGGSIFVTAGGAGDPFTAFGSETNLVLRSNDIERLRIDTIGRVGIGTASPNVGAILDLNGTGNLSSLLLPRGTTAQRAVAAANGMIRYNTNLAAFEVYGNNSWQQLATSATSGATDIDGLSDAIYNSTATSLYMGSGSGGGQTNARSGNTAIGYQTLASMNNDSADSNTAVGTQALNSLTSANENTAVGRNALRLLTTGNSNTAVGINVLENLVSGDGNVAMGRYAMYYSTGAASNVAIGEGAAQAVTTGGSNVAVGYQALFGTIGAPITGGSNVAVGRTALSALEGGSGGNLALGDSAGTALTSGSNNIFVGVAAGDNVTSGGGNLLIGQNIDAPSATGSNQMSIGNMIFGTGIGTGSGTTISGGRIGIASNAPQAVLDVVGTGSASALIVPRDTTAARSGVGVNGMIRYNTNLAAFEVYQNNQWAQLSTSASAGDFLRNGSLPMTGQFLSTLGTANAPGMAFTGDTDTGMWSNGPNRLAFSTQGTGRVYIDDVGNVGIGTTNPSEFLVINNDSFTNGRYPRLVLNEAGVGSADQGELRFSRTSPAAGRNVGIISFNDAAQIGAVLGAGAVEGYLQFSTDAPGAGPSLNERMRITAVGNVGIGTTSPNVGTLLDLNGTGNLTNVLLPRGTTAQRAATPANGMLRYNSNSNQFEGFGAGGWAPIVRARSFSGTSGAIDWSTAAAQSTSFNCATDITFANLVDGGSYTLSVTDGGTTQCNFSTTTTGADAATVNYRFNPTNGPRATTSHTVYSIQRIGTTVYISWISGF